MHRGLHAPGLVAVAVYGTAIESCVARLPLVSDVTCGDPDLLCALRYARELGAAVCVRNYAVAPRIVQASAVLLQLSCRRSRRTSLRIPGFFGRAHDSYILAGRATPSHSIDHHNDSCSTPCPAPSIAAPASLASMDPRRQALPPLAPPTPYRQAAYGVPPQPQQRPPPVPYYPVGLAVHPSIPSGASRVHAHTDFEPSPLDPSRRVVQRPSSTYPASANYGHSVQAAYTMRPQSTVPYGGRYAPSQGSLTPPSPARPLNADLSLFPAAVKQTDILELHNEVMRRGRALDWKDEQIHKDWRSTVLIDNREWSVGLGKTKKEARHKAAKLALPILRAQP